MTNNFNAPGERNRVDKRHIYRDTRSVWLTLTEDLKAWDLAICFILLMPVLTFYSPAIAFVILPAILFLSLYSGLSKQNRVLPMKLPVFLKGMRDYNDVYPGNRRKFFMAGGTILLGNLQSGRKEVWIKGKDLLTHMMVIGTTGGGKTELLVSLSSASAFCMGGGLIYVDAKAAPKLLYQFVTLCRLFGREDDLRVINYQTGNMAVADKHFARLSNTTNPFAQGTANTAVQTLTGLLPSGGGDNQYFLDRAIAILRTLMPALVELRDQGIINIYPSLIGECISIEKFIALGKNDIEFNGIKYPHVKLSDRVLSVIKTFLKALPNFNPALPASQQPEEATKQFGFAEGYFARTLANLAGTYGHIYETELAEADFVDIVMHNRILIVMVPAAESSSEERSALGKVVLSSIRVAMAQGLGNKGEGDRADTLDSLPIDLRIPTIVIVDEYAEVAVEGFAVTATQGRGLGMSLVIGAQDLAGIERANEAEANMLFANTNIKVLLKLQDPHTTWERFKALAGSMKVATGGGWEHDDAGGINTYKTQLSASIQEADRIDIDDLKGQIEGEAHLFEGRNIHRVQMFHHGINDDQLVENFRINRMLKVKTPSPETLDTLRRNIARTRYIETYDFAGKAPTAPSLSEELAAHARGSIRDWIPGFLAAQQASVPLQETSAPTTMDDIQGSIDSGIHEDGTTETPDSGLEGLDLADMGLDDPSGETEAEANMEPSGLTEFSSTATTAKISSDANDDGIARALTTTLSKPENMWIFSSSAHHYANNVVEGAASIVENLANINESLGSSADAAREISAKLLDDVSSSVNYPSSNIESLDSDPDGVWELTKALNQTDKDS